jgi:hypothetical protein
MIASVYIKDGNIHFYNEQRGFSQLGGIAYRLGMPLLKFACYEHDRFDEAFSQMAGAFEVPGAEFGKYEPEFLKAVEKSMTEFQQHEIYVYFYLLELHSIMYSDDLQESPQEVVARLSDNFRLMREFVIDEIELLLKFREKFRREEKEVSSLQYLYWLEDYREKANAKNFYLERPFTAFYGTIKPEEVVELYEIHSILDLFRFEFTKMIEHDVFIKKCKNCGHFFIPKRRADAEYCEREFEESGKKCSEVGAMHQYEKRVAENPILDAHKKAYRRFNSRTRMKKMTQAEFLQWSEQASQKRDECLAGELPFDEYLAWLEQGRIRRSKNSPAENREDMTE